VQLVPEDLRGLSDDPIGEHVARMVRQRDAIRERFIELYLAATGARIEDTVLVQQVHGDKIKFWCEPK
jgi:predicted trehalose synthase